MISTAELEATYDRDSTALDPIALAVAIADDEAAIAAAGWRTDGKIHVEIIDMRSGTDWLEKRVAEIAKKHRPSCLVRRAAIARPEADSTHRRCDGCQSEILPGEPWGMRDGLTAGRTTDTLCRQCCRDRDQLRSMRRLFPAAHAYGEARTAFAAAVLAGQVRHIGQLPFVEGNALAAEALTLAYHGLVSQQPADRTPASLGGPQ